MSQLNYYPSNFQRQKQIIIAVAFVLFVLSTTFDILFPEGLAQSFVVRFAETIGFGILILAWCHYDAAERNKPLSSGLRLLLVLFGIFGLLIYLLKTRGVKRGLIAIGVTILLFIGMIVVSALTASVFAAIMGSQL